ncbi:MAG TPA: hypothetical protein VM450_13375 [Thermomicrobiales bacterium]|nr:hypothetical protein [Thermomicrobiales bacterium]
MMQRTIGAYIANKIKDEIFSPQPVQDESGEVHYVEPEHDPLDGQLIRDNQGRALGRAYRLPDIAVYVVSGDGADRDAELQRAVNDEETELILHWEGNRIAALVYVPEQAKNAAATGLRGFRADDV